jgi:hypothetical protein
MRLAAWPLNVNGLFLEVELRERLLVGVAAIVDLI